jgi:dTDP-glucose 4,6-dehydratase
VFENGVVGEIYNVGAGNEKTNLEVARVILKETGRPESLIKFVQDRPGHDKRYSVDATKTRRLGWKPQREFEEALKKTIDWYLGNESWWKPLVK